MDKYIGFDLSDKQTVACLLQPGQKDVYQTLPTDPVKLKGWLRRQRQAGDRLHLTFETCGQAGWLYDHLVDAVDTLKVSNPSLMSWIYRTPTKSDRIDARKQAVLLQMGELPEVHMPSAEVRQWRRDIQHRTALVANRSRQKNRLRSHIKSQGYCRPPLNRNWWTRQNIAWMRAHFTKDLIVQDGLDHLDLLEQQIRRATRRLDQRLAPNPAAFLLQSIHGIGPRTTEAVLAYTDRIERFTDGKAFASYFGLTPKLDQSGAIRRSGHISKRGPSVVRWLLVEAAWQAIRKSPALRAYYDRILRGKKQRKKIAIVAVARKLLEIMRAMLLSGEVYNESLVTAALPTPDRTALNQFYY